MDREVSAQVGAGYGERSEMRTTRRNGYRPRRWDARVGSIDLQIPKLRQGSYFPALLEPRRRAERALLAVVATSVRGGGLHTPRRRPRALARLRWHLEEPGLAYLLGARHGRHELPRPAPRLRPLPLPLARRAHPARTRGGPHRPGERGGCHCGQRGGEARGAGHRRRYQRGRGLLAGVSARPRGARALRRGAGDLRRPPGSQGGYRHRLRRRLLAALPHPLHAEPAHARAEECGGAGGDDRAHDLPAALGLRGARPARTGRGAARGALPRGRGDARRRRGGDPGVHGLPGGALAAGLVSPGPRFSWTPDWGSLPLQRRCP